MASQDKQKIKTFLWNHNKYPAKYMIGDPTNTTVSGKPTIWTHTASGKDVFIAVYGVWQFTGVTTNKLAQLKATLADNNVIVKITTNDPAAFLRSKGLEPKAAE